MMTTMHGPAQIRCSLLGWPHGLGGVSRRNRIRSDFEEPTASTYTLQPTWILSPAEVQLGEEVSYLLGIEQEGEGVWEIEVSVLQPNFSPLPSLDWEEQNQGYQLTFTPETTGVHIVSVTVRNTGGDGTLPTP